MSDLIIAGQQAAADRDIDDGSVAALQQAVAVISSVCDYAKELDAQGFNAADAWLGHVLAQMPPGLWSDSVALTAWDMLRKYRGQLAGAGIDYDQLPRPAGAGELEAGRREQARERARGHARQWREQQYRQTHSYVRCDGDGEQVVLAFPYDPDLVAECRQIDGRRYDGAVKANVFPFTSLPAVVDLAARHGIEVTADVRALAAITAGRAAERAAQPQVRLGERDGTIIIDASLDASLYQKVKDLDGRWDNAARVHRVPGHHAPALASLAEQHGLRVSDQVRQFAAETCARQEENRTGAGAFEANPVPVPGLAVGLALKPQQYPVVRFALAHRRVLIGDDMGWGKTLSSLAAAAADGAYPAVVVCRPSLTLNWAAEITRFFPDLVVEEARGTTPHPIPAGADVIIIGSAALAAKPRKTGDGGKEFGWVEELTKAGPKTLIIDEGQDTKERAANRSRACEQLAAAVIARDGLVLDLTGTAILNRPRELCQQLTILGRIAEFGGPKAFLWRYCLSETNSYGASYDGARNLIELHDRLRAWGIMIRRSDDSALGLPPCREHVLRIPQAALDPAVMNRYRQAEADLLGFLAEKARQAAAQLGEDPASAAVAAAMRASAAEHLVAINTLRQLAGQAKRGYVTGWVREHVAAGEKVMVAAHHREEVDAYAAAFGGLKLQGGQPVAEKEAVKARFQQQPASQAPVIAVAIGAGGVGHTLTAAAIGIQAEQAWTPGETQQMKKRLHRIGQDREVDYYITVAEGTIDEHLQSVVTAKQATLDAVLDGRSDTGAAADDKSVAAELTWRLTQQGLGTGAGGDPADDALAGRGPAVPAGQQAAASPAEWSWKWSGDLIKVYAGTGIAGRIYRDQGPRGTFYRAETASDPYRCLASDREVARHLPSIDAAVAALRADRDREHQEPAGGNRTDGDTPRQAAGQAPALAGQFGLSITGQARTATAAGPASAEDHPADEDDEDTAPAVSIPAPSRDGEAPGQHTHGQQLREAAHRYLEDGLLPVPAWSSRQNGECCCPRGADCGRPGKHPRSVRAGSGSRTWSWKLLACRTHAEIDQRFPPGGEYAAGNLMVAIPEGMMAIDRDDDDGGRAALAQLSEELGELPPTLAHKTPHGEHLIYRTPPGWKGRAWVGKDPANPVPAGIDLRMPGQVLMAAPSVVPGQDGPARYGPVTVDRVASLPAAYVTAWTPPQPQPRPTGPRAPVPPDSAGRAARYVHDAMTRIVDDLARHEPGGRNAAAYAAGLKAGSLLGAARATPGAEHAAAWTGDQAEEALMDAAERNGYTGKDGQAEALRAIRSGLRNGLRNPRALPDFTTTPSATDQRQLPQPPAPPAPPAPPWPQRGQGAAAPGPRADRWQDMVPDDIRRQVETADRTASGRRRAAIAAHQQALGRHSQAATADTAAEVERTRAAAHAAHQAYTQDGRHITGRHDAAMLRWAASITAQREQRTADPVRSQHDTPRMQANRAAVAANQAYKAGDLDRARQLTDQAAALDPSRAELWQQHRQQIAARRLILDARTAHAGGDHQRARQILGEARQLDPRMPAIWDGDLPALPPARPAQRDRHAAPQGPEGTGTAVRAVPAPGPQRRRPATAAENGSGARQPSWPASPAHREPGPAAAGSPQADGSPPAGQRPATATPGESRHRARAAVGDPDASTELPGNGPAPWSSPEPRSEPEAASPARQAGHEAGPRAAVKTGAGGKRDTGAPDAAPSADWRDDIVSAAREAWQPGPSWPDNPALRRLPEAGTPDAGIEPDGPHA